MGDTGMYKVFRPAARGFRDPDPSDQFNRCFEGFFYSMAGDLKQEVTYHGLWCLSNVFWSLQCDLYQGGKAEVLLRHRLAVAEESGGPDRVRAARPAYALAKATVDRLRWQVVVCAHLVELRGCEVGRDGVLVNIPAGALCREAPEPVGIYRGRPVSQVWRDSVGLFNAWQAEGKILGSPLQLWGSLSPDWQDNPRRRVFNF